MDKNELIYLDPKGLDRIDTAKWVNIVRRNFDFSNDDCYEVVTGKATTREILERRAG